MKFDIEWESYHPDGRKRARPPASTVHGWLTKMRGTLLDNETLRRTGIREMKQAKANRLAIKQRNTARAQAGRPPLRPSGNQPWLRLSFLRHRPTPASGSRKQSSSTAVVRHKGSQSRPKPTHRPSTSSRKSAKKPDNQVARTKKRSVAHKRSGKPAKKAGK